MQKGCGTFYFLCYFVDSLLLDEWLVKWLTWEFYGQVEKKGLKNSSSLLFFSFFLNQSRTFKRVLTQTHLLKNLSHLLKNLDAFTIFLFSIFPSPPPPSLPPEESRNKKGEVVATISSSVFFFSFSDQLSLFFLEQLCNTMGQTSPQFWDWPACITGRRWVVWSSSLV